MSPKPGQRGAPAFTPRAILGLVVGGLVAAFGALLLGEYEFTGFTPFFAGPIFGLVVAEVVVSIGRLRSTSVATTTAAAVALGLLWAAWRNSGEGVAPLSGLVWPAMVLGAVAAAVRLWPPRSARV
ncbi:hypothetical protein BH20ACT2_BH20ACT2_18560 [soil metagenome]